MTRLAGLIAALAMTLWPAGPPPAHAEASRIQRAGSGLPMPAPPFIHLANAVSYDRDGLFAQDAVFDDAGADSGPDIYSILTGFEGDAWPVGEQTGVGDIRSVRVRPAGRDAVVVDVTMNSLAVTTRGPLHPATDPGAVAARVTRRLDPVVFVGVDDRPGGFAEWPHRARLRTPGLDRGYTMTFGGFAEVTTGGAPVPAVVQRSEHTVSVRVEGLAARRPRLIVGAGEWDAGVGVWRPQTGSPVPVLDLAVSCPTHLRPEIMAPARDDAACEWAQAADLGTAETAASLFTVDLDRLGRVLPAEAPAEGFASYVFTSHVNNGDGYYRFTGNPQMLGTTQAFTVGLPRGWRQRPNQLVVYLHGGGAWGPLQAAVDRWRSKIVGSGRIVLYPYGRGPAPWWMPAAEADVFEAIAAAERLFPVDSERRVMSGISMGGYGTYRIASAWPDVFAGALVYMGASDNRYAKSTSDSGFPFVDTDAVVEALANVPLLMLAGTEQTVHEMELRRRRLDSLGYEHTYKLFANPVHGVRFPSEVADHVVAWLDRLPPRTKAPRHVVVVRPPDPPPVPDAGAAGDDPYMSSDGLLRPNGAWWVTDIVASGDAAVVVRAESGAIGSPLRTGGAAFGPRPDADGPAPVPVFVSGRERALTIDVSQRASIVAEGPVASVTLDLRRMQLRDGAVVDVTGVPEIRATGGRLCASAVCRLAGGRGRLIVRVAGASVAAAKPSALPATGLASGPWAAPFAAAAIAAFALAPHRGARLRRRR